jgi:phage antirepressor YoqD-like protein
MSNFITISGVRGYIENGVAQLNAEDISRGLGFTQIKNSVEYVRWETVNGYLCDFGFSQQVGKDSFIPENIFYRLAMKAKNEAAERFQELVADEILPSIRKHGGYLTPAKVEEVLLNPDTIIRLATDLKVEREKRQRLEIENAQQSQIIDELQPKATYYDLILQTKAAISITQIAKDYGMTGTAMNTLLHELGVQFKQGEVWLLYKEHAKMGYTTSKTHNYTNSRQEQCSRLHTYWTQKGRLFIYALLKNNGILPLIEREGLRLVSNE